MYDGQKSMGRFFIFLFPFFSCRRCIGRHVHDRAAAATLVAAAGFGLCRRRHQRISETLKVAMILPEAARKIKVSDTTGGPESKNFLFMLPPFFPLKSG